MSEPSQGPAEEGLRINAVAELSGLGVHTIRAWERRYGVPKPPRSAGRQRLYSREDVRALKRMAELSRNGVALGVAARMVQREMEDAGQEPERLPMALSLDAFITALLAFDEQRASELWTSYLAASDVGTMLTQVLIPTLQRIGDGWHEGSVSVAQEHFASGFIRGRLEALARQQGVPRTAPTVMLACLPDNWHEMSLLMLNVVLRFRGIRTVYLGQAVPMDDLVRTVEDVQPAVLVLHGWDEASIEQVEEVVAMLAARAPLTRVVYGGKPFEGEGKVNAPGAMFGGRTLVEGLELIERLARSGADST